MKGKAVKLILVLTLTIALAAVAMPAVAEEKPADNMKLVQEKIKADKKLFIAENMQLTEKEGKAFWPLYDSYQKDLGKLNDRLIKLIEEYAQNYETMTDQTAKGLITNYLSLEAERVKLLQSHMPKFSAAVGDKKAARYMQLENKISAVIRFDLAGQIPLVK